MNCFKCGREIPEGELLCPECSEGKTVPMVRSDPASVNHVTTYKSDPVVEIPEPAVRKKHHAAPAIIVVLLLLFGLSAAGNVYLFRTMTKQRASFRIREANLTVREQEMEDVEKQLDALKNTLSDVEELVAERDKEIEILKTLVDSESSSNYQTQYEAITLQNTITELEGKLQELEENIKNLQSENGILADENTALSGDLKTRTDELGKLQSDYDALNTRLSKAQDEIKELNSKYTKLQETYNAAKSKADFLDKNIYFVKNSGSTYYHHYGCSHFSMTNYSICSKATAIANGYTACPYCN